MINEKSVRFIVVKSPINVVFGRLSYV